MSTSESVESPTFEKFSLLPGELREAVYKFATPPRVVVVQEDPEDFVAFKKRLARTWRLLELDPSLAHFAFVWRDWLRSDIPQRRQRTGGSGRTQTTRPWTPSESTPELPVEWLRKQPPVAYEFLRRSQLYSRTPIPALLHVCVESRETLIRWGYRLAFRARSSEPWTWFHFDRDILFLKQERAQPISQHSDQGPYKSRLLSGGPWAIGHFHPEDLCKIRNVALEKCAMRLLDEVRPTHSFIFYREVSNLLRLFGGVRVLQMVEWAGDSTKTYAELSLRENHPYLGSFPPEPLVFSIPIREEDAILQLFSEDLRARPGMRLSVSGAAGEMLKHHKQKHGMHAPYFEPRCERVVRFLTLEKDRLMSSQEGSTATDWNIPHCSLVHILSPAQLEFVMREREKALEKVWKLKVWASQKTMKEIRLVWEDAGQYPLAIKHRTMLNAANMLAIHNGDDEDDEDMGDTEQSKFILHQQSLEAVEEIELEMIESLQKDDALLRKVNEVMGKRVSANSRKSKDDGSISSTQEMGNALTVQMDVEDASEDDASEDDTPVLWLANENHSTPLWSVRPATTRDERTVDIFYQHWLKHQGASQQLQHRGTHEIARFYYVYGVFAWYMNTTSDSREWWGHEGWISALDEYEARSLANNSQSIEPAVLRTFRGRAWRRACSKNLEFCGRITGYWDTDESVTDDPDNIRELWP